MKRATALLGLIAILLVGAVAMVTISLTTPASAAEQFCTHDGHAKATLLRDNCCWPDTTWAEARESGWWSTSGPDKCYQYGLYNQNHRNDGDYSYCYDGMTEGYLIANSCLYKLEKDYWYQRNGSNRYTEMRFRTKGDYSYNIGGGGMGSDSGTFSVWAKFIVRYDGSFRKSCWTQGSPPQSTYLHCEGGRGK